MLKTEENVKPTMSPLRMLAHLATYARRHPWMLSFVIFSVFAAAAASRTLPWIIGYAIDHAVGARDAGLFLSLAWLYLGVEVLKTFFTFMHTYFFQVFGNRMLFYVREDLYKHVLDLPLDYFNRTPVGRLVTRMTNDTGALAELFSDGVVTVFTQVIILLTTLTAMFMLSWKLTLITILSAPFFIWLAWTLTSRLRLIMHDTKMKLSAMNAFLAESLSGIRVVQLYNKTPRQNEKFASLAGEYRRTNLDMIRGYAWLQPVLNLFNACIITTALWAGGFFTLEGAIPLGAMITFLIYAQDFIPPIREILEKIQQFQNSLTSAERVFVLLEEPVETDLPGHSPEKFAGRVQIKNLTFQYRPDLPPALIDVNLEILAGQSVAVVGRTGSGKSTLISLLQKFYPAPVGTIRLDDVPLEQIPRQHLRRHLGVIQQDPVLFRGSLLFNITLGHHEISRERALTACQRIGLKLPLETNIEERGANLSLGERQLVAFARILAFDPHLLIMDEATANIDSETEQLLHQATREVTQGRTSILIAHRLSTVEHCDQIVVLEKGRIAEKGAPAELLKSGGLYAQLASAGLKSMTMDASADGTALP